VRARHAVLVAVLALVCAEPAAADQVSRGRGLFVEGCSSCHGFDARGVAGQGPSLVGAGAAAADFYLSTGRMPLDAPGRQPLREHPAYNRGQIDALVAYIGSLGPGPKIPHVDPARGDIAEGQRAFTANCAGCHQVVGRGGVVVGGFSPSLREANPTQIAEAVRIGPYLMPPFDEHRIDRHTLDSIVRYLQYARHPDDRGGWGLFEIGPVPEGMVAWLLGALALVVVIVLLGERNR
jgi:ubiquinol-cytochrome c reductase cytochrome c subunit